MKNSANFTIDIQNKIEKLVGNSSWIDQFGRERRSNDAIAVEEKINEIIDLINK